ncbi:uncharacterized protein LOC124433662 [Xenia sp. Carnegie-2017]|uniref:uncharacterized protein LOC124433662 n=1 Tax=Xenia sp. Carnegie-2017 TaxID=2897299 RepID=UPI001F041FB9|nr:uncharacterized protein LOC124433662 [Xenia sp. Carnegie-2017]
MALSRSGNRRVKPYSLTVKTYSAAGKLSRKNISLSPNVVLPIRTIDAFEGFQENLNEGTNNLRGTGSRYERRRVNESESWKCLQDNLVKSYIENCAMLPGQLCVKCLEDGIPAKKAEIRCRDCGHGQFYCFECAESLHRTRNVFHLVEVWKTDCEMFVPLLFGGILRDSQHANCSSTESRTIICVDGKGRQHLKIVEFCQCIKDAEKLIKLQLWPGSSSKPKIAFHFDFMDFAEKFLLESHVSLHKFCSTVEVEYPEMLPRLVCISHKPELCTHMIVYPSNSGNRWVVLCKKNLLNHCYLQTT